MSFVSLQRTKNKKKNKKKKKKKGSEYRALLEAYVMMLVWVDTRSPDFFSFSRAFMYMFRDLARSEFLFSRPISRIFFQSSEFERRFLDFVERTCSLVQFRDTFLARPIIFLYA